MQIKQIIFRSLLAGLLLMGGNAGLQAQTTSENGKQLAFPGAAGWGRFATGGRTGSVYHVTNLNDSGTGSLRDAISQSNRIIVFDVAGVIKISDRLVFKSNQYIAGQTAPGEGITVYGNGVSFSGASNIIVRHMRFRMGKGGTSGKDCAGIANGHDMIFDHCSFSWGLDETFSINPSSGAECNYITISNSIMGQGLTPHSAGGLMQDDYITLYRNLYCDNSTRNNKVKGINQYVNNIVYNWSSMAYNMGGDSSGDSYCNIESNLFINGPSGGGNAFSGGSGTGNFYFYGDDNWQDSNKDGVLNPSEVTNYAGGTRQDTPYDYPSLEKYAGNTLIDNLLPTVGATLPYRDIADFYMVHEVKSFGTEGALIATEEQLPYGVPSTWTVKSFEKPVDTDGDGMPDVWETANGTDPATDDAMTIAANGYANIENYINSLSADNRTVFLRVPYLFRVSSSTDSSITFGWSDYTEEEDGFILEQLIDGAYQEVARIPANAESYTWTGLTPATTYNVRLKAYKGTAYSDAADLVAKSKPKSVDMVDCDNFTGDDDNWLIAPVADSTVTLSESVVKTATVVRSDANVTMTGDGSLDGDGSLNKTGKGTLTVETLNGYKGATVLHNGTFSFSTLKNGGEASGIGASDEFAQNWIWDGGVWNYTGTATSTNRSVQLYQDTEFDVQNAVAVNMSGSIEGDANVTFGGKGTIVPADTTFFKYGNTTLKDGATLKLTYTKTGLPTKQVYLGDATANPKLTLAGGTFQETSGASLYLSYHFPIEVLADTYSKFYVTKNCSIRSVVTGAGTLEYHVPYVREYLKGDWTKFYGTLVAVGDGTGNDGSQLMMDNGFKGFPNTKIYLKGNTRVIYWGTGGNISLGGLSGDKGTYLSGASKQTPAAVMTWKVGGANTDEVFNGIIDNQCSNRKYSCTVNIVKEGSGAWRLTGNNTYKGTTAVAGGNLIVNGKHTGGGAYTVTGEETTLSGTGSIASAVTIGNSAIIQAGDSVADASTLTLGSTLNVISGGVVNVLANKTEANTIAVAGAVTLGEGAVLKVNGGEITDAPYANTEYKVFSSASLSVTGTFAEILPTTPGEGQEWDTSALYTEGILKVIGGEENPNKEPEIPETPESETKTALLTWGNMSCTTSTGSTYKNLMVGTAGDDAEGFSMFLNKDTKYYSAGDKINVEYGGNTLSRTTIKLSNGAQNIIYLPTDAKATKITFWSYTNKTNDGTNRTCYWAEVAGTTYTAETATTFTNYKNTASPNVVSFELNNVENQITFANSGEQQCVIIAIEYHTGGTSAITNVEGSAQPLSVRYYNLSGVAQQHPTHGIFIQRATMADGTTVTKKVVR